MKFSENWLRSWVNPPLTTAELVEQLTMAGIEVDGVEPAAALFSGVIIGEVLKTERHPNAERLTVCLVDIGDKAPLTIVCGAKNVVAQAKVPVATVGAGLPGDITIQLTPLRGVLSAGMICSQAELGLGEKGEGIWILPEDAPIGTALWDYLQLNDTLITVDLTPNRGDCLSIQGMAREVAALNNQMLTNTQETVKTTGTDVIKVTMAAGQYCPRYTTRVITGIDNKHKTPLWIQEKLRRSGIRSISLIVDITNFVMLELGQPLHAFDKQKIASHLTVRMAETNESFTLLDNKTIALQPFDLVIADETGPLALAGIMGGNRSAVSASTETMVLESAYFSPLAISRSMRYHGIISDSATRFARGVDSELPIIALDRAAHLIAQYGGGMIGPLTIVETSHHLPKSNSISLRLTRVSRLLGVTLEIDVIQELLTRLGIKVTAVAKDQLTVTVPSYRFDLAIEEDLIEEIARVYGYNQLPAIMPHASLTVTTGQRKNPLEQIKNNLVARGFQEAITYSFISEKLHQAFAAEHSKIALANPISNDMVLLRATLIGSLFEVYCHNRNRQQSDLKIFEVGNCYEQQGQRIVERLTLSGLCVGKRFKEQWAEKNQPLDFYDVKKEIEIVLASINSQYDFQPLVSSATVFHPGQSAAIYDTEHRLLGVVGALHPALLKAYGLNETVFAFELFIADSAHNWSKKYQEISKFPAIRRDLAILVNEDVGASSLIKCIKKLNNPLLQSVNVFDVYRGTEIGVGKKSMAFALTLQHPARTLQDDEVNQFMESVVTSLKQAFDANLRG